LAHHEDHHQQAHAEGGAEVGQGDELEFFEVGAEAFVLGQGDDGGVVAQEGHDGAEGCHAGEVEERAHQRFEQSFNECDDAKLYE
jgi:hypothetical protein